MIYSCVFALTMFKRAFAAADEGDTSTSTSSDGSSSPLPPTSPADALEIYNYDRWHSWNAFVRDNFLVAAWDWAEKVQIVRGDAEDVTTLAAATNEAFDYTDKKKAKFIRKGGMWKLFLNPPINGVNAYLGKLVGPCLREDGTGIERIESMPEEAKNLLMQLESISLFQELVIIGESEDEKRRLEGFELANVKQMLRDQISRGTWDPAYNFEEALAANHLTFRKLLHGAGYWQWQLRKDFYMNIGNMREVLRLKKEFPEKPLKPLFNLVVALDAKHTECQTVLPLQVAPVESRRRLADRLDRLSRQGVSINQD